MRDPNGQVSPMRSGQGPRSVQAPRGGGDLPAVREVGPAQRLYEARAIEDVREMVEILEAWVHREIAAAKRARAG